MKNQSIDPFSTLSSTAIAPHPSIKKASLFCVSIREKGRPYHDVLVVALTVRDARRLAVNACESEGLINRHLIKDTLVFEKEAAVYQ